MRSLPEQCKVVQLASPETTNGGKTSIVVSLKNVLKAWLIVELTQAAAHATQLTPTQATNIAAGTNKALTNNVPIWANEDCAASDALVPQTDAKNYSVAADVKDKQVIFEIDPAIACDVDGGYDCLYVTAANSGEATNFWTVTLVAVMRYQQATPPSIIAD